MPGPLHLDSSTIIVWSRGKDARLRSRFLEADLSLLSLSFVVEAELLIGMAKSAYPAQHRDLRTFLGAVRIVHSTPSVVQAYVQVRATLERTGLRIGDNDLWIAATALAEDATLVTLNTREFARVEGLRLEDWQS